VRGGGGASARRPCTRPHTRARLRRLAPCFASAAISDGVPSSPHAAMREHLGKVRWRSFVAYAEAHYKEQFVSAFEPDSGVIACAGPIEGGAPRPHARRRQRVLRVARLGSPADGAPGIDRARLCRMLFGVTAADGLEQCLHFRCGLSRGAGGHRVACLCHSPRAHYAHSVSELRRASVRSSSVELPDAPQSS
jgi:hypothetical protein